MICDDHKCICGEWVFWDDKKKQWMHINWKLDRKHQAVHQDEVRPE